MSSKTIVLTFGRFNPPTIGHGKLIKFLSEIEADAHRVHVSQTVDAKRKPTNRNPLGWQTRIDWLKRLFPCQQDCISSDHRVRNFLGAASIACEEGFTDLIFVTGEDRLEEFTEKLNHYNGGAMYDFKSIRVVSAGDRHPDAEDVEGVSSSKMRAAVVEGRFDDFKACLPIYFGSPDLLWDDLRIALNV